MSTNRTRRIGAALAAALATALALAGCTKIDMDLSIEGDLVDGTLVAALDRDTAASIEIAPEDVFGELDATLSAVPGVTEEPYQDGPWTGSEYTFDQVRLDDLNQVAADDPDGLRIVRDQPAGTYELSLVLDLEGVGDLADPAPEDPDAPNVEDMLDSFEATITVTFPGEVTEHNGELAGTTVTWRPPPGERSDLHAVALDPDADPNAAPPGEGSSPGASPGSDGASAADPDPDGVGIGTAVLVGLGVLVLAAVGLGIWLMRRHRPATSPPSEDSDTDAGTDD